MPMTDPLKLLQRLTGSIEGVELKRSSLSGKFHARARHWLKAATREESQVAGTAR